MQNTIMQSGAGMDALRYSYKKLAVGPVVYRLRHLQNIFIQVHHTRVTEQKVEVLQRLS
jgi:hypothetical protein